jgi:type IV secretion system protein TrbI
MKIKLSRRPIPLKQIKAGKTPIAANAIPQLGPPLPGDIGHAYAIQSGLAPPSGIALTQNDTLYAASAQASSMQQRRAEQMRQLEQAQGSGLFFASKSGSAGVLSPASENTDIISLLNRLGQPQTASDVSPAIAGSAQNTRDEDTLNPHALTPLISPYTVLAGSLIPAALIGDMNSDLPGMIQAQVTANVYDSVSGKFLLIPQGSKLIGHYDARIVFGQERALVIWTRLILPDGSSMILEQFNGTDARGQAGLSDKVDWHTGKLVKGVILSSLLGVGSELSFGSSNDDSLRSLARAIQNSGNSAGQEIVRRNLEVKPTIRIRGGTKLNVLVSSDLLFKPWEQSK